MKVKIYSGIKGAEKFGTNISELSKSHVKRFVATLSVEHFFIFQNFGSPFFKQFYYVV